MKKTILKNTFFSVTLFAVSVCTTNAQLSDYIHVDQFGYRNNAEKVAVLSDPQIGFNAAGSYTPGAQLELRKAGDNTVVFTAAPAIWGGGATHGDSGDKGWWFDFSSYTTTGDYYVYDSQNDARSAVFSITENPYIDVLKSATKMFYYNRCNAAKEQPYSGPDWVDGINFSGALQDANCRYIFEPDNATLEKNLTGGWFDAGDYNKYVTFTHPVVHSLLFAYEENSDIFKDNWNLPESGNGLPDFLDEIKWELDWLHKMSNADGSAHIKMGSSNYGVNTSAPPSNNNGQRFYGPLCSAASATIASVFAHAAKIYKTQPGMVAYATTLEQRAIACFNNFKGKFDSDALDFACDNGEIVSGDADSDWAGQVQMALVASVYLYQLTGNTQYKDFFESNYNTVTPISTNFWDPSNLITAEALLIYTQLPDANVTIKNAILGSAVQNIEGNWVGVYDFNEDDLYRAYIPDYSYHWGSNQVRANIGAICNLFVKYNVAPAENAGLTRKANEELHHFHGVNALGMVQLSNMYNFGAERSVNELYHCWFNDGTDWDNALTSVHGPAPGFVTGGANSSYSGNAAPPSGQPRQKSYADSNGIQNPWEITEPAIYYQAAYIRFLSHYVLEEVVAGVNDADKNGIAIYPNPSASRISIKGITEPYVARIIDAAGKTVITSKIDNPDGQIDVTALSEGVYIINITTQSKKVITKKLIKT